MRRLGRNDDALALLAGRTDWCSVVERGAVHRDRNELGERIACFDEAAALRPDDVATRLDLELAIAEGRAPYLRLRARVRRELAET
jgi:hypothetical protein